ncbi:oligosaccharide flippase family protein [Candidatus Daviesbacteria bacterium]|nr:oligosaccharide flippase family protein [Candidatus Daviesbacteria bacterium]
MPNHYFLSKVSKQTFWQLIGKTITSLSTVIILSIVSRNFGESGTGVFTLSLTYLAFFTLIIDFGVNAHLMPQLIKADFEIVWRKLFGFRLILVAILVPAAILGGVFWPTTNYLFKQLILIGSIMAILGPAVYVSANAIFQSRLRYDLSIIGWSGAALTTLVLVYITSSLNLGLPWLMVDYSIGWLIGCILLLFFVKKFVKFVWPIFDINFAKDLIKKSWPISATLALNVIYFRVDVFILSSYHSFAEVGIYNLAYQIFQSVLVIPTFMMNAYYPLMLKSWAKFKQVSFTLFGLSLLCVVLTLILAPFLVDLITGARFLGSSQSLQILSFSFPAFFLSNFFMCALLAKGKYTKMFAIYLTGLSFNLILNLVFIPKFSYLAASWITVISEYLILILQIIGLYWIPKRSKT